MENDRQPNSSPASSDPYVQKAYRCQSGIFWDYVLTEREVLSIKIVSRNFALVIWIAFVSFLFLFVSIPGALLEAIVIYFLFVFIAWSRRKALSKLSPEDLVSQKRIAQTISWEDVTEAELNGRRLKFVTARKKIRTTIQTVVDEMKLRDFLKARLSSRLTIK